jgi:hypothetical protein
MVARWYQPRREAATVLPSLLPLWEKAAKSTVREIEPDEGFESKKNPSPAFASLGTLSHKGRGKEALTKPF